MKCKGMVALLVTCILLFGCAKAETAWTYETLDGLANRIIGLACDENYVRMFTDDTDVLEQYERMAALKDLPVKEYRFLCLREDMMDTFVSMASAPEWSALAREVLAKRFAGMAPSVINSLGGAAWLAACSVLTETTGYLMPEGFAPGAVLMEYGTDVDVMITFVQTGEDVITATAAFVDAQIASGETLSLFYTEENPQ